MLFTRRGVGDGTAQREPYRCALDCDLLCGILNDRYGAVSGKITALAVDPTNADTVFAGTAGGGLWKSIDAGSTWAPLTDDRESMAIGSIAIDGTGQVIYAGTGEGLPGIEDLPGQGVLKSTDGGARWALLGNSQFS